MVYKEFYEFLKSNKCPVTVRLTHAVAKENYERGSRLPEATNADVGKEISAEQFEDDSNLLHYLEALKHVRDYKGLTSFYRGEDGQYDFTKHFSNMDPNNNDFDFEAKKYVGRRKSDKTLLNECTNGKSVQY